MKSTNVDSFAFKNILFAEFILSKKLNTLLTITILIFTSEISASDINGRFVVTQVSSSKIAVLLQLNTNTGTDKMGGATIVLGFDTTSLSLPANPVQNVDYVFQNFSGGYYSPATITRPVKGRAWINIDLPYNNTNHGTLVSGTSGWTGAVIIYFQVTNVNGAEHIYWLPNSPFWGIYKDDNVSLFNTGSFENVIGNPAAKFQLSVNTSQGWNLVSIPGLLPDNQNVTSWWPGKDPNSNVLKFGNGFEPVTVVSPGCGYWVKNLTNQTYNTGDEWPAEGINVVSHNVIPGVTGWNAIGGYEQSVPASGVTTSPPGIISGGVYKYSPGSGYQPASQINPGYGYLVKLTANGSINIPTAIAGSSEVVAGPSTEGFGKIIFTDAELKSYTLYSIKGETDITQFELPPYPPDGMFDVRYSSQRYAEMLTSPKTVEMTGLRYPVKIKTEETDINISDEYGKEIAKIKAGEEITLNNSLSKLIVKEDLIPAIFTLEQNYPNPFNPSTKISWQSPSGCQQTLKVYDILGNEVATLVDEYKPAGSYEVVFNAGNLASGVYVYRLQTASFTETKKMVLLR